MILTSSNSVFVPILKHFASDRKIITFDPNFKQTLTNVDLKPSHISELVDRNLTENAFRYCVDFLRSVDVSPNGLGPEVGNQFSDAIMNYLYPKLADFAYLALALDNVKPEMVLLHNDVEPPLRLAASWAQVNGVPCLHVPHAVYLDINRGKIGSDIHDIITASHLAAAGNFQRQWYETRGFRSDNIRETGMPKFDAWVDMPMDRERARRLLKISKSQPVVTYASTWRQDTNLDGCNDEWQQLYINILKAFTKLKDVKLIIKSHPNAGEANFRWHVENAEKAGLECIATPLHLEVVLHASDVLLAPYGSNVLLEGSFVPGLRLMTTHGYEDDNEVMRVGKSPDELREGIIKALSVEPPDVTSFQYKYTGIPDGKASERVIQFMEDLF